MNTLNSYMLSVCFSILFCVAVEMLTPSDKYRVIIRMASGIFIIYTLISPVKNILNLTVPELDFSADLSERGQYHYYERKTADAFDRILYSSASKSVETAVKRGAASITDEPIEVYADVDKNGVKITVSGVPPDKQTEVYNYIKNNFGTEPSITE